MKKVFYLVFVTILTVGLFACSGKKSEKDKVVSKDGNEIVQKEAAHDSSTVVTGEPIHLTKAEFLKKVVNYEANSKEWKYLGDKPCIIDFWATWCPYCLKEMPAIEAFYHDYQGKDFTVLALSTDNSEQDVRNYLKDRHYTFPIAMSEGSSTLFGEVKQIPTSFIIDKHGVIRHKVSGQVYYGRIKELVEPLLEQK